MRMAFPEFSGGQVTAEEMEGKTFEGTAEVVRNPPPARTIEAEACPDKAAIGANALRDRFAAVFSSSRIV